MYLCKMIKFGFLSFCIKTYWLMSLKCEEQMYSLSEETYTNYIPYKWSLKSHPLWVTLYY